MELKTSHTLTLSATTVQCRSDGDVAALRVKGELVDVHFAGADDPHVLLGVDRPVVRHENVGVHRGLVLLYPETSHKLFSWHG